ncbi:hypothetical protein D3C72_2173960 [compost metagenome]
MRGMTMPLAGSPALGSRSSIRVTFCPTFTSSALARSMPSTMLYEPGVRSLKLPCFIWLATLETVASCCGSTPRTTDGRMVSSLSSMPWVSTNGDTAFTCGLA